jgi:hypothetical protein
VLSMSRMVGGTFGVAVMGALIATIGRTKIDQALPHVPASTRAALANSLGAGGITGHGASASVVSAVHEAFVSALGTGLLIGAGVTLCGAALAFTLVAPKAKLVASAAVTGDSQLPDESSARELTAA